MLGYIFRRILFVVPTLIGIILLNFIVVQFVPGGPVDQFVARQEGHNQSDAMISSSSQDMANYQKSYGVDQELIDKIRASYGFDQPAYKRFFNMLYDFATFSFGESYFQGESTLTLIKEALPVSASLGVLSTLLIYGISIPLGILRARNAEGRFDVFVGLVTTTLCALPAFLIAILLLEFFASEAWLSWFPLRGIGSGGNMGWWQHFCDWIWHMTLPVISMSVGGFAALNLLTRNSFIEEIHKNYVTLARAKGLRMRVVMMRHVFRNAMLIVIAGFPSTLIGMFFMGSLLIEVIFSLKGLGLLGYESILNRDYPVVFASLYLFSLLGLIVGIISDICYALVDPRIHFAKNRH